VKSIPWRSCPLSMTISGSHILIFTVLKTGSDCERYQDWDARSYYTCCPLRSRIPRICSQGSSRSERVWRIDRRAVIAHRRGSFASGVMPCCTRFLRIMRESYDTLTRRLLTASNSTLGAITLRIFCSRPLHSLTVTLSSPSSPSGVINVSSLGHPWSGICFDDIDFGDGMMFGE
jgi:hypothetical protein